MTTRLIACFGGANDVAAKLEEARAQGVMMLPVGDALPELSQYETLTVTCQLADKTVEIAAELVQAIAGAGLVVAVHDLAPLETLARDATAPAPDPNVEVSLCDEEDGDEDDEDGEGRRKLKGNRPMPSVLSWPIEKLQAEFSDLPQPDRIRLARWGKRPARQLIARSQDKMLHNFLLLNPKIGGDEIAALVGHAGVDPALIKRVISSPEWMRHGSVARALMSNPKLTNQQVLKVMRSVPLDDLRRMARTGRVRASVKREIIKYLEARGKR